MLKIKSSLKRRLLWCALLTINACFFGCAKNGKPVTAADNNKPIASETKCSTENTLDLVPEDLSGKQLKLTINSNNTDSLKATINGIGNRFTYEFKPKNEFVLTPYNLFFQKKGSANLVKQDRCNMLLTLALDDINLNYETRFTFVTENTGQWHATIADNHYQGTFTYVEKPSRLNSAQGRVFTDVVVSQYSGLSYKYIVYLPKNYHQASQINKTYPLVMTTDGEWGYQRFKKVVDQLDNDVVLFSISMITPERRRVEFVAPAVNDYIRMFEEQLVPLMQDNYRVMADHRTIEGHSLGGLMVYRMLLNEMERVNNGKPRLFHHFISADGSFRLDRGINKTIADEVFTGSPILNAKLYITGAAIQGNALGVRSVYNKLRARNVEGLMIKHKTYLLTHGAVKVPSLIDGLAFIFSNNTP